jgi:hypothetical protein
MSHFESLQQHALMQQQLCLNKLTNSINHTLLVLCSFKYILMSYCFRLCLAAPKRRRPLWDISVLGHYGDMQGSMMFYNLCRWLLKTLQSTMTQQYAKRCLPGTS